ncbi:MAG: site-2 protease family protein [Deltaproteobacteria bacterium]|nr:site-2 protease family protein [Deltaproteobacteria bacterium]
MSQNGDPQEISEFYPRQEEYVGGERPGPPPGPEAGPSRRPRLVVHAGLFLATVVTTILAGAIQQGVNPFETPGLIYKGIPFSFTLLFILGAHEMGHYLISRWHRLDCSLPYFLPAPPFPFIVGTFGAFIRIRSPIQDKRALLDVGCSGPLVGVAVSVPVLIIGLKLSTIKVMPPGSGGLILGEPLLFQLINWLVIGSLPVDHHVLLHPVAFAGWIGLLVTTLNLLPVGQLDGGHVAYALFPDHHRKISLACLGVLVVFGVVTWAGWLFWALLLVFLGFRHPPPAHYWISLDRRRKILGMITIIVFLLTFTPTPFVIE